MRWYSALLLQTALTASVWAGTSVEYRSLDGVADPHRWAPAECDVTRSPHAFWEHAAVKMHIPVDFHAGEKEYPIGWPRMYCALTPDEQDWRTYDRFEFQLFAESSRAKLPVHPLTFHLYGRQGQKKLYPLDAVRIGETTTVSLAVSDLGLDGEIVRLGFNINEADYNDRDLVDFHIGGFRLVRATLARIVELKAAAPALFGDSRALPIEVAAEGPSELLSRGVPFVLQHDKKTVFAKTLPVTRGRQTLNLPLDGDSLAPGDYTLVAYPDAPELRREAGIVIVSSPWH